MITSVLAEDEEFSGVPEPVMVDNVVLLLSPDDMRVLKFLFEKGGECYQKEIYMSLGLPPSTVSYIVRKFLERGIVMVERRGRYNYVKLSKNIDNILNNEIMTTLHNEKEKSNTDIDKEK